MEKKIFISYSDNDKSKMRSLEKKLLKTSLLKPIIIADKRQSMLLLSEKVIRGIHEADFVVPILTKKSMFTQWINQEIGYARALAKEIKPIVEQQIMPDLRGFINSQIDIPYNYASNADPKRERSAFRRCCDILIEDLVGDNNKIDVTLSDVFSGKWVNAYEFPSGRTGKETVEIQNG